ncbi:MICOS complex subunit MIC25 isoform X2 [Tribolium madens]|uniref:MICOS complex subunit MIC25 isoform X2 n=1 Tax=Tribolium madens TaxID=41895 RepID=UPI001CF752CB|nr:MICOS complex subunit MIC25 isoform X2 [Tribolium madens]
MGGSQSRTRKLTVENDDPTSVIKVSDDVVQRIKNNSQARPAAPEPSYQQAPPQQAVPVQPMFIYEPSVTSVQLRQANLAELKKNDHYWENRLKNQQANHQKINEIMEAEYKKAIEEMEVTEKTKTPSRALPPCQDAKEAVMRCYREHANEPMKCAKIVQAFQQCVDSKRASLIANRG